MRVTDKYVFFFTEKDIFSNWYIAPFKDYNTRFYDWITEDGLEFCCVEQYMMWRKATLFRDYKIADAIIQHNLQFDNERDQAYYKRMGRRVQNYSEEVWLKNRERIVKSGLLLKYEQNTQLKCELLKFADKYFVEASPYDAVYGIKMGMLDQGVEDPRNWKGSNLLGQWHNDLIKYFQSKGDKYEL